MLDRIRTHGVIILIGAIVAVLAALSVVKSFFTDTAPWLVGLSGGWLALLLAIAAVSAAFYYAFQYYRYRAATKKLMWRYIIDVQDAQAAGAPGHGLGTQSEAVKRGEASADRTWGDPLYRELLHLPPEDEYR